MNIERIGSRMSPTSPAATDLSPLVPRSEVLALNVPLAGGGWLDLANERPRQFELIVFYRGWHCQIHKAQLKDLGANRFSALALATP